MYLLFACFSALSGKKKAILGELCVPRESGTSQPLRPHPISTRCLNSRRAFIRLHRRHRTRRLSFQLMQMWTDSLLWTYKIATWTSFLGYLFHTTPHTPLQDALKSWVMSTQSALFLIFSGIPRPQAPSSSSHDDFITMETAADTTHQISHEPKETRVHAFNTA